MSPTPAVRRSPLVLGALATLAVLSCLRLGVWQLDRAAYKAQLHEQMEQRMHSRPRELLPGFHYRDELRFSPVVARGHFVAGAQLFVDNRVHAGQAGAAVYAPFAVGGQAPRLLVERGWVPWSADRSALAAAPLPQGEVELRGFLDEPPARSRFLDEAPAATMAGTLWPYLDWQRLHERAGPLMGGVVLREAAPASGALVRIGPALEEKRGMHIGYAVQWFCFAGIIALVAVRLLWRGRRDELVSAEALNG